jgi:hypothetical protein
LSTQLTKLLPVLLPVRLKGVLISLSDSREIVLSAPNFDAGHLTVQWDVCSLWHLEGFDSGFGLIFNSDNNFCVQRIIMFFLLLLYKSAMSAAEASPNGDYKTRVLIKQWKT